MNLEISKFREVNKSTLQGFLSVKINDLGLEVRDIALHRKNGSEWLQMPSRPYIDSAGNKKYAFILDWFNAQDKTQFETKVFGLLRRDNHVRET